MMNLNPYATEFNPFPINSSNNRTSFNNQPSEPTVSTLKGARKNFSGIKNRFRKHASYVMSKNMCFAQKCVFLLDFDRDLTRIRI